MSETRILADFIGALHYDDLPADVVETAKLCILDTVGVTLAAAGRPWSGMVAELVAEAGGTPECTVWGRPLRVPAQQAALANGTAAHGIEMDDRQPRVEGHFGSMVVPAAVAACEREGAGGRELITAVVAGYELGMRVGQSVRFDKSGPHGPGNKGVWGAVGAAGKALELDEEQLGDAFGLAGSMASGIIEFSQDPRGTMVKRLHAGLAARGGVLAALLARKGLTGPATVLEGTYGYCATYAPHGQEPRLEALTHELGATFRILERELKPYAAWGGSHLVVDAVGEILGAVAPEPGDIAEVHVGGSTRLLSTHENPAPRSIMAAQFSLPFVTALALCRGPKALMDPNGTWRDEILQDRAILDLAARVRLGIDTAMDEISRRDRTYGGARVTVTLRDGSAHAAVVHHSKGTLDNPMTGTEIEAKFRSVTAGVLDPATADRLVELVAGLDRRGDARTLVAAMGGRAARA